MGDKRKKITNTYEVKISSNALKNFDEIMEHITSVEFQPANAIKVGQTFYKYFDKIELNPYSFGECKHIPTKTKMYRQVVCLSWIIVYKINTPVVTIIGIIHKSRQPSKIKLLKKLHY